MRLRYLIGLLLLPLISSSLLAADPGCKPPADLQKFVEAWRAEIGEPVEIDPAFPNERASYDRVSDPSILLARVPPDPTVQWLAVTWNEPRDGAIFVLDCAGNRLASAPLMATRFIQLGPRLPGLGDTLAAWHVSGIGTGVFAQSISLLAFRAGKIVRLWRHEVSDSLYQPDAEYEDRFSWSVSADGLTIRVSGTRQVRGKPDDEHGWLPGTTHLLPEERWCWTAANLKYEPCPSP